MSTIKTFKGETIREFPLIKWLTNDARASLIWLPLRVWLGWQWVEAASHKISDPKWMSTGEALKGFWMGAVAVPDQGRPPITFEWYRTFLQFMIDAQAYTWFAKVVAMGEMTIGIALIIGAFTGIAAFFGGFMNWNFMMAGSASTNPMLFVIAVSLIVAWKVSGYIGADFFLLRFLGTPWHIKTAEAQPVSVTASGD